MKPSPRTTALRTFALALGAVLATVGCTRVWRTADLVIDRHPDVVYAVPTDAPLLALTLDDGPDPLGTPALLDVLARHGATATFFVLGERAVAHPQLVEQIVAAGHELGNHGMHDVPALDLAPAAFTRDVRNAHDRLLAFQSDLRWYRPGSAWYDDAMVESVQRLGYTLALGSIYPFDAQLNGTSFAAWWLRVEANPGDVIVLHDGPDRGLRAAKILGVVLPDLAAKGLRAATLSELVATRTPGP